MPSFTELPPRQLKVIERRLTPNVRRQMGDGLKHLMDGISDLSKTEAYRGAVTYAAAVMFGEDAKPIDWKQPPQVGISERRYLAVIDKLSRTLEEEDSVSAIQVLKGIANFGSSNSPLGQMQCSPELLVFFPAIRSLQPILEAGKLNSKRQKKLAFSLTGIKKGFEEGDRTKIFDSLTNFHQVVKPHLVSD